MKKTMAILASFLMAATLFAGCSSGSTSGSSSQAEPSAPISSASESGIQADSFDASKAISVVSREPGSGTRGAFIELFKVEVKDDQGNKTDRTTDKAVITNQTEAMLSQVAGNPYAIGYVSMGSLNDTVKALKIDGVTASVASIKAGEYKVSRPFVIIPSKNDNPVIADFVSYILSKEGQAVIAKSYISVDDAAAAYSGSKPAGKIVVGGSSSVSPIMEKLIEAYQAVNPAAEIELQTTDSGTGIKNAQAGTYDIGMASRELKEEEAAVLPGTVIATDGIAVIVSPENPTEELASATVTSIFTGELTKWSDIQ